VTYFDVKNERQVSARNIVFDGACHGLYRINWHLGFIIEYAIKVRSIEYQIVIIDISKYDEYTRY